VHLISLIVFAISFESNLSFLPKEERNCKNLCTVLHTQTARLAEKRGSSVTKVAKKTFAKVCT
jgi:hypothetical protein